MKFKVVYEIRVKREIVGEADSEVDARYAVQNGQVGGEVDVEDVESPDIVGCEVVQ
mgnify:CR=1 FL=1